MATIKGKIKSVEVFRKSFTLDATGTTQVDVDSSQMPKGLIHGYTVKLRSSALTGLGAAASDYPKVLRNATWGAAVPKFEVATAIPGKFLDKVATFLNRGVASARTTPTTGGFAMTYRLPFSFKGFAEHPMIRPKDTGLINIAGTAQPFLNLILGPYSDLGTTISAAPSVVVTVIAHFEPNPKPGGYDPVNPLNSGDEPTRMLEFRYKQKADLSSSPLIGLTTSGPRECWGVIMRELDNTGAEVSDIFTGGVATPSKFEVKHGDSDVYTPRIKVVDNDEMLNDYAKGSLPAGYHAWIAAQEGKLSDAVPLDDGEAFQIEVDNLATTANRVLDILQIGTVGIPKDVLDQTAQLFAAQAAAPKAP